MHTIPLLSAAALVLAASAASAQNMKPGLWEITTKMKSSNGEMEKAMAEAQKQMAAMPPEQRKQMEGMMASRGVQVGQGAGGAMAVKVCMTKEMVERSEVPPPQGDCKTTTSARSGNTTEMAYTCTNPPSSGKGKFTFISSEAYTSQMTATSTGRGKPEQMDIDSAGKWLGTDCGTIKPIAPPVAKK